MPSFSEYRSRHWVEHWEYLDRLLVEKRQLQQKRADERAKQKANKKALDRKIGNAARRRAYQRVIRKENELRNALLWADLLDVMKGPPQ